MAVHNSLAVFADSKTYRILDLISGHEFPLFPFNIDRVKPFVVNISEDEFLVTGEGGSGGMGIFVSSHGDAVRGK